MNKEILAVIEAVANEKALPRDDVIRVLEAAMIAAVKRKYHPDAEISVVVDLKTGSTKLFRRWKIVEAVLHPVREITLEAAQLENPQHQLNEYLEDELEEVEFDRLMTQTAKQVIIQKVRELERESLIEQFRQFEGQIVTGIVRRVQRESLLIDLGQGAEAILARDRMLPRETYRIGDRVRAILVISSGGGAKGPQLYLDRTAEQMLTELMQIEVPEIAEGLIDIRGVAREPGVRAKVAVFSRDKRLDPIGACIGMRGARVQSVSNELGGEKIDLVLWDEDLVQFVIQAMSPAEILSIVVDEEKHEIDVGVEEHSLPQAIGRNGQNVKLAAKLTGWQLNVMSISAFETKQETEQVMTQSLFETQLAVTAEQAKALTAAGFVSLEEIAYVPLQELEKVEHIGQEAEALRVRARERLIEQPEPSSKLMLLPEMTQALAAALSANAITTVEALAEKSTDELIELNLPLTQEACGKLIMAARELCWFQQKT